MDYLGVAKRFFFTLLFIKVLAGIIIWYKFRTLDFTAVIAHFRPSANRTDGTLFSVTVKPVNYARLINSTSLKPAGCVKFPEDIVLFNTKDEDTSFCCKTCAIVSSSGTMLGSNAGESIDANECVIRMNNAPNVGYEKDVGTRTTFRFYSHTSVVGVKIFLSVDDSEAHSAIFIAWGPKNNINPGHITYNHMQDIAKKHPGIKQYVLTQERMKKSDDLFEIETGKNRLKSGSYLSTGFFTVLFAKDICDSINIYGMIEDDYCSKSIKTLVNDVPYHYYEPVGRRQCSTYSAYEKAARGAHRFITEKKIFKNWAKEWKKMQFHNPEWDLSK